MVATALQWTMVVTLLMTPSLVVRLAALLVLLQVVLAWCIYLYAGKRDRPPTTKKEPRHVYTVKKRTRTWVGGVSNVIFSSLMGKCLLHFNDQRCFVTSLFRTDGLTCAVSSSLLRYNGSVNVSESLRWPRRWLEHDKHNHTQLTAVIFNPHD